MKLPSLEPSVVECLASAVCLSALGRTGEERSARTKDCSGPSVVGGTAWALGPAGTVSPNPRNKLNRKADPGGVFVCQRKLFESNRPKQARTASRPGSPPPEAKQQATTSRIIALVLWALAIAGEVFAIFWMLKQTPINMVLLIVAIVVIGILAVIGDLLWKRANRLDPASRVRAGRAFSSRTSSALFSPSWPSCP